MALGKPPTNATPSQDFVPIEQVRDGVIVLKDGSLRAMLMASSLNIALKSEDEQAAILVQFQNFLNSLDFSAQFFIQSRELDIRPYIALLEKRYVEQQSELMKIQVREYIEFVKGFVEGSSIMSKNFFVVVPYTPPMVGARGSGLGLGGKKDTRVTAELFEEYRSQLEQRVSVVQQGLGRTGVRVAQLGTEEVIELFYKLFNIGELERPIPLTGIAEQQ
jgi:type IV secretory pathway VirB4 component